MKLLDKKTILAQTTLPREVVDVPEWGGQVLVRALSGQERDAFESSLVKQDGKKRIVTTENIRARLCQKAMINEDGSEQFSLNEIPLLGQTSAAALDRVYDVVARLSGISDEDVEKMAKNSGQTLSDDGPSGSQPNISTAPETSF